jgi:hypothetical protein
VRRKYKGALRMPKIGYGNNKKTRHLMPSGFYKFVVHNAKEVDMLLMHNRTYAAQVAHNVGVKKRQVSALGRFVRLCVPLTLYAAPLLTGYFASRQSAGRQGDQPTRARACAGELIWRRVAIFGKENMQPPPPPPRFNKYKSAHSVSLKMSVHCHRSSVVLGVSCIARVKLRFDCFLMFIHHCYALCASSLDTTRARALTTSST